MSKDPYFDPFSAKDFITITEPRHHAVSTWEGFQFQSTLKSEHLVLADIQQTSLDQLRSSIFKLSLEVEPLPDIDPVTPCSIATSDGDRQSHTRSANPDEEDYDIWNVSEPQRDIREVKILSWDTFEAKPTDLWNCLYVTEASSTVYDEILCQNAARLGHDPLRFAKKHSFLVALRNLALGEESAFFRWQREHESFQPAFEDYTISGISRHCLDDLVKGLIDHGNLYRSLRSKSKNSRKTSSIQIACTSAVSLCLDVVQEYVEQQEISPISVLRLHISLMQSMETLRVLQFVQEALGFDSARNSLILDVMSATDTAMQHFIPYSKVLMEILRRTLQPAFDELHNQLSQTSLPYAKSSAEQINKALPNNLAIMLAEVQHQLSLLSVASSPKLLRTNMGTEPRLELLCSWDGVVELLARTDRDENQAMNEMCSLPLGSTQQSLSPIEELRSSPISFQDEAFAINLNFERPNPLKQVIEASKQDIIRIELSAILHGDMPMNGVDLSPFQALEHSISPPLAAQHRLTSCKVLDVLFAEKEIAKTFNALHGYLLLSNGNFSARLSSALFQSEKRNDGQQPAVLGNTGLRLQDRESWPPATSELRLALMNILAECLSLSGNKNLQDNFSFAIRDLPDEELEKIRDINSIHALDFLRLSYKSADLFIESVIDANITEKYDRIFRFLLVVLRLRAVSQSLLVETLQRGQSNQRRSHCHRLRFELHHFISAITDYCHGVAIAVPWQQLEMNLARVHEHILVRNYQGALESISSIEHLRQRHDSCLNEMMDALFLSPKQAKVMLTLETVFGIALRFSAACNRSGIMAKDASIYWYKEFRTQRSTFLEAVAKAARRDTKADESIFYHLLLRLN